MAGGFETGALPVDPRQQPALFSTDDVPLDAGVLRQLTDQVAAEAPAASAGPVAAHRGGLFTMSPDGRFVLGPVPGAAGLRVNSGCNGSGFSSSPALGEALAAWITGGERGRGGGAGAVAVRAGFRGNAGDTGPVAVRALLRSS